MSWDQQAYSFGNPNAQPPTPTQTPTSATFQSPTFQTPGNNSHAFDSQISWNSTFVGDFNVFNATPGHPTGSQDPFGDFSTPRPASSGTRGPPGAKELETEVAPHVHHLSIQTALSLPPVDSSAQISPSAQTSSFHGRESEDKSKAGPVKPRRRLEEAFSGQTATPPRSATKSTRKLAPKPPPDTMQHDEQSFRDPLELPNLLTANSTSEMFPYPMSAPVFSNTKPLWEPDTNMIGMDMDISFATDNAHLFESSAPHRLNASFDWGRSSQIFQDSSGIPPFDNGNIEPPKRKRPLAPKVSIPDTSHGSSSATFGPVDTSISHDPLAMIACTGAVDPGLLFTLPECRPPVANDSKFNMSASCNSRPLAVVRRPYEHQQRESERDEERRRSRIARDSNAVGRRDWTSFSSPVKKGGRSSVQQSISDGRPKTAASQASGRFAVASSLPTIERRATSRGGRISPVKQNRACLGSIPETVPGARTSVTFSIDANGRARAETKIIVEEPKIDPGDPPCTPIEDWNSSNSGYSSDEELIILPSRSTSFSLPQNRTEESKSAQFEKIPQYVGGRRHSVSNTRAISRHGSQQDQGSESETVIGGHDTSGDAANALRKVMKDRKQNTTLSGGRQQVGYSSKNTNKRPRNLSTPHHRQLYNNESSLSSLSPTTVSDPDLETPSTDPESTRGDGTRCVCHNRDSYGFMIQCESCEKWLHAKCVGVNRSRPPNVYICAFCAQTPNVRGGRIRDPARGAPELVSSPLAHKSFKSWR